MVRYHHDSTGESVVLVFLLTYPNRALGGIVISGISEVSDWRLKVKISRGFLLAKAGVVSAIALSTAWTNSQRVEYFWELFYDFRKGDADNAEQYHRIPAKAAGDLNTLIQDFIRQKPSFQRP
jgi:hypothetical protein